MNKLQKKIIVFLIVLALLTPIGIFLPMWFNAGDAWGEWSSETMKELVGYVPEGLQKYSDTYTAPMPDYTLDSKDTSVTHQSLYYILSGIAGVALTLGVTMLLLKGIIKKKE